MLCTVKIFFNYLSLYKTADVRMIMGKNVFSNHNIDVESLSIAFYFQSDELNETINRLENNFALIEQELNIMNEKKEPSIVFEIHKKHLDFSTMELTKYKIVKEDLPSDDDLKILNIEKIDIYINPRILIMIPAFKEIVINYKLSEEFILQRKYLFFLSYIEIISIYSNLEKFYALSKEIHEILYGKILNNTCILNKENCNHIKKLVNQYKLFKFYMNNFTIGYYILKTNFPKIYNEWNNLSHKDREVNINIKRMGY